MLPSDSASPKQENETNKRRWLPLVLIIVFLAVMTSSLAGFIIGKHTGAVSLGQIIDTILLAPEEETVKTAFHLSGKVLYSDGTPAAGRTLELHSDPITTTADSQGGFLFPNVPEGEHTIRVMNNDGSVAAQQEIQVSRTDDTHAAAINLLEGDKYVIELSVDVRVLEIEIQLEEDKLHIDLQRFSYGTVDGYVYTPAGSASLSDGAIVTPAGNVYLPDGHIVFPGGSQNDSTQLLLPDDTLLIDQPLHTGDIAIAADGTVTLPDGTEIQPGGQIQTPDGQLQTPGDTGVVVDTETVTPIGGSPEAKTEPDIPTSEPEPSPAEPEQEAPVGSPNEAILPSDSVDTPMPPDSAEKPPAVTPPPQEPVTPVQPPEIPEEQPQKPEDKPSGGGSSGGGGGSVTPPPPVEDKGKVDISAENGGGFEVWDQHRTIDLFYNRETQKTEQIAPGSSGYYLFQLKNGRQEALTLTLSLTAGDGSPYLPLQFTLRPQGQTGGVMGTLAKNETLTLKTTIDSGASTIYQLDWEWPFTNNDAADTAAGQQGGQYKLLLTIHAEGSN